MKNKNTNSGYIAIMTSVFISIILLSITVKQNSIAWDLSFNLKNTEDKIKSEILAKNCIKITILQITNQTYKEHTKNYFDGYCINYPLEHDSPQNGSITIKTKAVVNNTHTNIKAVIDKNQEMKIISYKEIPSFE